MLCILLNLIINYKLEKKKNEIVHTLNCRRDYVFFAKLLVFE